MGVLNAIETIIGTIKFKRGLKENLPTLKYGEPAYIYDENELYIGGKDGDEIVNKKITRNSEVAANTEAINNLKTSVAQNTSSLNDITNQITTKQLTSGTDLNSIKTPDVKYFTKGNSDARGMINIPHASIVSFSLEFFKTTDSDVNYGFQTLREYNGSMWIRALQDGIWLSWKQVVTTNAIKSDTGWIDLTLINGVTTYNGVAQYRRIGNVIFIRGSVTNISTTDVIIATLPTGFRPVKVHTYTNFKNGYQPIALRIVGDGSIYITGSANGVYTSGHFYNIDTSFLVD